MCDRPILIDNPYKGLFHVGLNKYHDCTSDKIPVPCGNCPSCIALRQSYYVQRCQMESINNHLFMMTLTYKPSSIRTIQVNNRYLYYPDFTDVQKMFKRLRNRGLKFRYIVVSEYGGNTHRPHFHAIISVPKNPKDTYHDVLNLEWKLQDMFLGEWRRNYGSDRKPYYKSLCKLVVTPRGRTYDFHYIHDNGSGADDVAFYVTKYVTKSDKWVDSLKSALKLNCSPDEFQKVWKLLKPRCTISKGFGDYDSEEVKKHIRKGIDMAILNGSPFPYFINPFNGSTFPLAQVYKRRFLTLSDLEIFHSRSDYFDGFNETEELNLTRSGNKDSHLSKVREQINKRLTSYDFYQDSQLVQNLIPEKLEVSSDVVDILPDDWSASYEDF